VHPKKTKIQKEKDEQFAGAVAFGMHASSIDVDKA
jgi:hypothetical protein